MLNDEEQSMAESVAGAEEPVDEGEDVALATFVVSRDTGAPLRP